VTSKNEENKMCTTITALNALMHNHLKYGKALMEE
jgi:hypothetical protein